MQFLMKAPKDKLKQRFLKIKCPRCGNMQVVFAKSSTFVKCVQCNKLLVRPMGGKTKVKAFVAKVFSWRSG